jgi:hypothetical protein
MATIDHLTLRSNEWLAATWQLPARPELLVEARPPLAEQTAEALNNLVSGRQQATTHGG